MAWGPKAGVSYERGPHFAPSESDDSSRRIRRLEDWAGRHDRWATQITVEFLEKAVNV